MDILLGLVFFECKDFCDMFGCELIVEFSNIRIVVGKYSMVNTPLLIDIQMHLLSLAWSITFLFLDYAAVKTSHDILLDVVVQNRLWGDIHVVMDDKQLLTSSVCFFNHIVEIFLIFIRHDPDHYYLVWTFLIDELLDKHFWNKAVILHNYSLFTYQFFLFLSFCWQFNGPSGDHFCDLLLAGINQARRSVIKIKLFFFLVYLCG